MTLRPTYLDVFKPRTVLDLLDELRGENIRKFHEKIAERAATSRGSSYNHQAWEGGYLDHIGETMRIAIELYVTLSNVRGLGFTLDSALTVLYFHDIEKVWKYTDGREIDKNEFFFTELPSYGINFTAEEVTALRFIHGEGDDYRKDARVMNELGAFCHSCDVLSARMWHNQGKGRGLLQRW